MPIDVVVPEAMQTFYEKLHYGPAVRHGDLIFVSGQIGLGETQEEEYRNAWQMIEQTLKAAGAELADIVEITSYHVGLQANGRTFRKIKDEFIKAPYPAWTAIGITELALPGAHVEIRVIARKP